MTVAGRATREGRAVVLGSISERVWQRQVITWAKRAGWHVHTVFDSRRSPEGWPDLFLVRDGKAIAVELKAGRGRLRGMQTMWLVWLSECGIDTYVWFPTDEAEVRRVLGVER